ncbi:hypothetical protein [Actinoplanes sp. L3-i22]|uniref:hypothetical protein n=1 Tax=Actinoplanes sp. L3-i22 TaxID=2836373 RepID=UPI001C77FC5B|nr:hypothetical protein [Actinoplanes sp. L3-i22]BCY11715.1 hypothetical protein L3i22_068030 [Actinoplanes sp. L3-i22]
MRTNRAGSLLVAGIVVAGTLVPGSAGAAAPLWKTPPATPLPPGATNTVLQDVSVIAPNDVWAVGTWWNDDQVGPFTVHWDGTAWKSVPAPELSQPTYLTGVDTLAPDNVWAVGSGDDDAPGAPVPTTGVLLHFDGTAWSSAPAPAAAAGVETDLDDIDMRTPDDGWAVGHTEKSGASDPLILHWHAGTWTQSAAPALPGVELTSVVAAAADDVWAVGSGAVLHFDGATWTRVDVPIIGTVVMNSVAAVSGEVWIGGATCVTTLVCAPMVLHRTATGWKSETSAGGGSVVTEVVASKAGVWTFGYHRTVTGQESGHVERWTGQGFQADNSVVVPGGPVDRAHPQGEIASATPLAGASNDPAGSMVWAVGWQAGPPRSPNVIYWS